MPAEILGYKTIKGTKFPVVACIGRREDAHPNGPFPFYGHLVFICPFCGEKHSHGAVGPNLGDGDGHRLVHCTKEAPGSERGYILKETTSPTYAGFKK